MMVLILGIRMSRLRAICASNNWYTEAEETIKQRVCTVGSCAWIVDVDTNHRNQDEGDSAK